MILFVGDKPSPKMKPGAKAFEGADCEARLVEWIAFLLDITKLERLFDSRVDTGLKKKAKLTYYLLNSDDETFSMVASKHNTYVTATIALGNEASKALTKLGTPHFKLPHPSGRNRQINDKEYIQSRLNACKSYIESFKK
jgi:hypothetical protein